MSEENLDNDESASEPSDEEQEAQLAAESEAADVGGAGKRTMGVERWVQLGYIAGALLLVWLSGNIISAVWYAFADPDESLVTVGSLLIGLVGAVMLYRHPGTHAFAHEIADELSKVSWPTRQETSHSTVVVVVTSIVAAAMLFMFDTIWSAVTDLVYKV